MNGTLKKFFALPLALLLWSTLPAHAQQRNSVSISALGSLPTSTSTSNYQQNPSSGAGFMIDFTHMLTPLFGYNVSYTYRAANQDYICASSSCPSGYPNGQSVTAKADTVTGNIVFSLPISRFKTFALAGGGLTGFYPPYAHQNPTQNDLATVFDYGVGMDYPLMAHIGLRVQYRGMIYKAPMVSTFFVPTGGTVHDAEPMAGIYYSF